MSAATCPSEASGAGPGGTGPDRGERGLTTSVQWAVLIPLLLGVVVAICDGATWWHARGVVQQASIGAAQSTSYWQEPGTARRSATILLSSTAAGPPEVTVTQRAGQTQVTVATDIRLITGTRRLSHTATAPIEGIDR